MGPDIQSVLLQKWRGVKDISQLTIKNHMAAKKIFLNRLREKLRKLRLHVWLLEGKEKHSGSELAILYAGHLLNKNYIAHLAFGDNYHESHLGKAWIWSVAGIARSNPVVALVVTETEENYFKRFGRRDDFYIPCWIDGEIEFSRFNDLMKHSENIKSDLRKIRKKDYRYEISRDQDKFDLFYHAMYRPYILKAHGNRAALMSYEAMMSKAGITELLLIKRGNDYIAGENLLYEDKGVRAWSLGVIDGGNKHVKDGVIGALYYYKINYLSNRGYDRYNAGASRAFLKDGVLQYKRKWGLRLMQPRPGGWWLRYDPLVPGANAFMQENPFIISKGGALHGCVFQSAGGLADRDELSAVRAKYDISGLEDLSMHEVQDAAVEGRRARHLSPEIHAD